MRIRPRSIAYRSRALDVIGRQNYDQIQAIPHVRHNSETIRLDVSQVNEIGLPVSKKWHESQNNVSSFQYFTFDTIIGCK